MSVRLRKWKDKNGKVQERWVVDVKVDLPGRGVVRVRDASPVNTRRGAEQHEREVRLALQSGAYGKEAKQPTPTLEEFVARFLVYAENNNKHSTVVGKKQSLMSHIVPALGSKRLDEIGPMEIEKFKADMRKKMSGARARKQAPTKWAVKKRYGREPRALSDKTINNHLSVLRKLLNVAADWGIIEHVPRVRLFKTPKPQFDFLSFSEAERLVAAADPEWRSVILLALKSGLRLGEIIGLQWTDIDLVMRRVNVRRTIWRGHVGSPKGGRARSVDVPLSVVKALKEHRHLKGEWVFCHADGSPFTENQLKSPLTRALRKSGISRDQGKIGWHDLRHTYGSHLAMKGVPLKVIQELMGHASIEMTMKYAHLSPETRQTAVQVLDEKAPAVAQDQATPQGHMGGT